MKIDTSGTIEQHSTWIAANPVVGCPKGCEYCFLRPSNLTQVKPEEMVTPSESISELLESNLYHPEIPVAIGTRTDMFATPANIKYTKEYIAKWNEYNIPNTLVMITKCKVPDEIITLMQQGQSTGSSFVIFLSYSGLDNSIEKGINHIQLKENFGRLGSAGIPVVHYWRPFSPQNSSMDVMVPVLETASSAASSSMVAGLKMTRAMVEQFGFWPELQKLDIDPADYESVYTQEALKHIQQLMVDNPSYPMYFATSCTISQAFKQPEFNGVWGTEVCARSSCPADQRAICSGFHQSRAIDTAKIDTALNAVGITASYTVNISDDGVNRIVIEGNIDDALIFNLSQRLKAIVVSSEISDSGYGWGSQVYKETLIIKANPDEQ
jgi:DNA repair photolyase